MTISARLFVACCVLMSVTFVSAKGHSGAGSVAPSSGKALCAALTPADFTAAGIPVSSLEQANLDGNDGAYCVYKSKAGKVEFDIFFPAGKNTGEIGATEKTVIGEGGNQYHPIKLAGADNAHISLAMPDLPGSSGIVVRKGKAVFDIVIPKGPSAQKQLEALAKIVMSRLKQ